MFLLARLLFIHQASVASHSCAAGSLWCILGNSKAPLQHGA